MKKRIIQFHSPLDTAGRIDEQNAIIHGVSVIQQGLAEGHNLIVDNTTLDQLLESANEAGKLPVKLDHGSGVSSICGYINNFRKEGKSLRGDWHLLKSHEETKKCLELARTQPETFGLSVAFQGSGEDIGGGKKAARCTKLKSIDLVTDPAANVNGLFSAKVSKHSFDNRPRTAQGMFAPQGGNGADPHSMNAAYAGKAQNKKSQVQKILSALKLRKPVMPAENPMLSSRGRTIKFGKVSQTFYCPECGFEETYRWGKMRQLYCPHDHTPMMPKMDEFAAKKPLIQLMAKWSDGSKAGKGDRISPKLDGIYAKATREGLFTKNGEPITGQDHIRGALNTHFQKNPHSELSGELYQHGLGLEQIVSATRTGKTPLEFHLHPGNQNAPSENAHIKHIPESAITSEGDLQAAHDHAVANGYEGLVIRRNTGKTFKKKSLQDSEYEILGGSLGKKHGILHLRDDKAGTFSVQAPRHIAENAPVGKKATVAYTRTTNSGLPHAPIFKGVRHDMQSKRKLMAFNFAAPFDSQTRKAVDTTSRQIEEENMDHWAAAAQEMDRRNVLRLKAGQRPLSLQEVFDDLEQSRIRLRGFGSLNGNDDDQQQNQPSPFRDALLGGAESAATFPLIGKIEGALSPAGSSLGRRLGVAAGVGAISTAGIGTILSQIQKRRQQQSAPVLPSVRQNGSFPRSGFSSTRRLIALAQKIDDGFRHDVGGAPLSGRITKDKYIKQLRDTDIANRDRDLAHAGIAGGAAGALLNRGKLAKLSPLRRAGVGALTGAAAVEGIRAITGHHRDIYGDRSAEGKAAEHVPAIVAGGAAAGLGAIAARKLVKSKLGFSIIRKATQRAVNEAIELSIRDQKLNHL